MAGVFKDPHGIIRYTVRLQFRADWKRSNWEKDDCDGKTKFQYIPRALYALVYSFIYALVEKKSFEIIGNAAGMQALRVAVH